MVKGTKLTGILLFIVGALNLYSVGLLAQKGIVNPLFVFFAAVLMISLCAVGGMYHMEFENG